MVAAQREYFQVPFSVALSFTAGWGGVKLRCCVKSSAHVALARLRALAVPCSLREERWDTWDQMYAFQHRVSSNMRTTGQPLSWVKGFSWTSW